MLDIKFIREHIADIEYAAKKKHKTIDLKTIISLDDTRKDLQKQIDDIRAQKNNASKSIPQLSGSEKESLLSEMKKLGENEEKLQQQISENEEKLNTLLLTVPNIVAPNVPDGKDDSENKELVTWGEVRSFDFEPKDHLTLMQDLGIVDIERGVKISGARGYFLKGDGMLLEQAVLKYAIDTLVKKGFTPMSVPYLVIPELYYGTGFFPGGEDDTYHCEKDNKYLIATSEVPLMGYHKDEIIDGTQLPIKYSGLSTCFRREAGSYGKDIKGLYRIHQFNKVEQVVLMKANLEESIVMYETILNNALDILKSLKLPHRVIQICGGDLAAHKYDSRDVECWMYSRGKYGETHSVSNLLDFQCRRLNIRYRDTDGSIKHCYSMNNTAIATPRFLIALLEHYQNADGSITVPEVLIPYMGKTTITRA